MNKLVKTVSKADLHLEFLKSLNGILELTNREIQVLEALITLTVAQTKQNDEGVTSTANRKILQRTLHISPDNLSRCLSGFKRKGILVYDRQIDEFIVNKALIPDVIGDRVQITIVLRLDKDDKES